MHRPTLASRGLFQTPAKPTRNRSGLLLVAGAAAVAVLARLPLARWPLSTDEGGFLAVAAQWGPGTSLYGDYWVDRPPLLIMIERLAALTGGGTSLRVIAMVGVAIAVISPALAVRHSFGDRAGTVTATAAAALLANPLAGAQQVDGELLAAPFVALGLACTLRALTGESRRATGFALLGGVAAAGAVLVKQNMLDVFVFAALLLLTSGRHRQLPVRSFMGFFALGAMLATTLVLACAAARGTPPLEVFKAMYLFRLEAAPVVASQPRAALLARLVELGTALGLHGVAALVIASAAGLLAARRGHATRAPQIAVLGTLLFGVVSIGLGGYLWLHYAVQLMVPAAVAVGLASVLRPRLAAIAVTLTVVASMATLPLAASSRPPGVAARVGHSLAAASAPGDTAIVYGRPDVLWASGLRSPYPYLWRLPALTRDPDMVELREVLESTSRPTWLIFWLRPGRFEAWSELRRVVLAHYRPVGLMGQKVAYLRRDRSRPGLRLREGARISAHSARLQVTAPVNDRASGRATELGAARRATRPGPVQAQGG